MLFIKTTKIVLMTYLMSINPFEPHTWRPLPDDILYILDRYFDMLFIEITKIIVFIHLMSVIPFQDFTWGGVT